MKAQCPHCGKEIDVVTSRDLESDFGLNTNRQQHLRDQNKMPKPWMEFPNRNIYLRADILKMRAQETEANVGKMVDSLEERLQEMSEEERTATLSMLRKLTEQK